MKSTKMETPKKYNDSTVVPDIQLIFFLFPSLMIGPSMTDTVSRQEIKLYQSQ